METVQTRGRPRQTPTMAVCEHCEKTFAVTNGSVGRFCSMGCSEKNKAKHWERFSKCASCHAALMITGAESGRMLNLSKSKICLIRKRFGMKTLTAKEAIIRAKKPEDRRDGPWWHSAKAGKAWMSEYNPKFPDWSYEWTSEKSRRKYLSMSSTERLNHNRKGWLRRKELYANDPQYRAKSRQYSKTWKDKNKDSHRQSVRKSVAKRKLIDPGFKVQCNLRHRLKEIMGKVKKGGSDYTNNLTGCTTKQLAAHLESQFKRGMTWANYGTRWHVDHILPCASFNHTDPRQVAQCWHWTNLRPLEAKKNMDKGATITEPQMSLLLCASH